MTHIPNHVEDSMHARLIRFAACAALLLAAITPPAQAQDKILRQLNVEQVEELLKNMSIDYKKLDSKNPTTFFYDYKRNNYKVRLHYYGGKDLMLDALFGDIPLEKLNEWNTKAKFSRATLHRDKQGPFAALESNLDIVGGVTTGGIEHFIKSFDEEVKAFDRFIGGKPIDPIPVGKDEKIVNEVSDKMIESVLDGMKIKYKKMEGKGVTAFEFESNSHLLRVTNFGGKDLMIDGHFKVIPLAKLNQYNIDNKFIRAVHYKTNNGEHVALESNLDCVGGVTESIIRYFINAFADDAKKFGKYVQDNMEI